jgi:hypothetical protein
MTSEDIPSSLIGCLPGILELFGTIRTIVNVAACEKSHRIWLSSRQTP